jgi:hypothetical protein
MKKHLKQFCDEYNVSYGGLLEWVYKMSQWPYSRMRLDCLPTICCDLLRAVAADYPGVVQIWRGENGWATSVPAAILLPGSVYRIKPNWTVPVEPDEPEEDEWFWGEAVWQTRQANADMSFLGYRIPTKGTDSRTTSAAHIPYMKIEGWDFVGFVYYRKRVTGRPCNSCMVPVRRRNGCIEYADWAVWRKT